MGRDTGRAAVDALPSVEAVGIVPAFPRRTTGPLPEEKDVEPTTLDRVYVDLAGRVQAGEGPSVDRESAAFLERDGGSERSTVLRAVVLLRSDRAPEAAGLLERYSSEHGPTALVLTNLAKAQASQGDHDAALATMARSLALDPNHENAVSWWAALLRRTRGQAAAESALRRLVDEKGSWRAAVVLAGERYAAAAADARALLASVRAEHPRDADVAAAVAQAAFDAGRYVDVVELLADHDPAVHGLRAGALVATALFATGDLAGARAKVAACRRVGAHPAIDAIAADLARAGGEPPADARTITAVSLFAPLSVSALSGASTWALPPARSRRAVAVLAPQGTPGAGGASAEPAERDLVLRGAAFGLAGALRRRGIPSYVVVPVVPGAGPAAGLELSLDEALTLLPPAHIPGALLRIEAQPGRAVKLSLFDLARRVDHETMAAPPPGAADDAAALWSLAQERLFALLEKAGTRVTPPKPDRLSPTWLKMLGSSLPSFLASAGVVEPSWVKNAGLLIDQALAAPAEGPVPEDALALATSLFVLGTEHDLPGVAARKPALSAALVDKKAPKIAPRLLALVRAAK